MTIRLPRIPRRVFIGILAGVLLIIPTALFILAASTPYAAPKKIELFEVRRDESTVQGPAKNITMEHDGFIRIHLELDRYTDGVYKLEMGKGGSNKNQDEYGSIEITVKNGAISKFNASTDNNKLTAYEFNRNYTYQVADTVISYNQTILTSALPVNCDKSLCYKVGIYTKGHDGDTYKEVPFFIDNKDQQPGPGFGQACGDPDQSACRDGLFCDQGDTGNAGICHLLTPTPPPPTPIPSPSPKTSPSPVTSPSDGPILPLIPSAPTKPPSPSPKIPVVVPILTPVPQDQNITINVTSCTPNTKQGPQLWTVPPLGDTWTPHDCIQKKVAGKNDTIVTLDSATCVVTFDKGGLWNAYATCNGQQSSTVKIDVIKKTFSLSINPDPPVAGNQPNIITASGCPVKKTVIFHIIENNTSPGGNTTQGQVVKKEVLSELFTDTNRIEARLPYLDFEINKGYEIRASCDDPDSDFSEVYITFSVKKEAKPDIFTEAGSCEICPVDWPVYDETKSKGNPGKACLSKDDESAGRYQIDPIRTDTCSKGYICDHVQSCVIPTEGISPPPQPCKRGIKYVDGQEIETTDPKEIQKCLEFNTAIAGINLDPGGFITSVLSILLSVSGMIALYLIVRSGYQLMTSRGNPEAIQEARERLTSAIVGLLLIIFSLVIMSVIGVDILKIPGFS